MWVQSSWRVVWSQEWRHGAVKTITRCISIFGSCVGFTQSPRNIHTYTQRMLRGVNFPFLCFAVLNPCLSVSSFQPLFVVWFLFFCTCEMLTRPGVRRNNRVHTTRQTVNSTKPSYLGCFLLKYQDGKNIEVYTMGLLSFRKKVLSLVFL